MKIYDMIEGKWLKEEKKEKKKEEKKNKNSEEFNIMPRLVTYDEEEDWFKREKDSSS